MRLSWIIQADSKSNPKRPCNTEKTEDKASWRLRQSWSEAARTHRSIWSPQMPEDMRRPSPLEPLQGVGLCQQLDLGLLVSRTGRE